MNRDKLLWGWLEKVTLRLTKQQRNQPRKPESAELNLSKLILELDERLREIEDGRNINDK